MLYLCAVLLLQFVMTAEGQNLSNCHDVIIKPEKQVADVGWPYFVSCKIFANSPHFELNDAKFDAKFQCVILKDAKQVVFNGTRTLSSFVFSTSNNFGYLTPVISANSSLNYTIIVTDLSSRVCFSSPIMLNVSSPRDTSCEDFLAQNNVPVIPRPYDAQKTARLACAVKHDEYPKISAIEGVTYQWLHNCKNVVAVTKKLNVRWNSIEQAGSYTCVADYNGRARYLTAHRFCLHKELSTNTSPSLTCRSRNVLANPGEAAHFACFSKLGEGRIDIKNIKIMWRKVDGDRAFQQCHLAESADAKDDLPCVFNNPHSQCYEVVPTDEEIEQHAEVMISLTIKNVRNNDYGSYEVLVQKDNKQRVNATLSISPNPEPVLLTQATLAGICVGAVLIFLALILLASYNSVYVRVYFKRYFGLHIIDERVYGASFLYNYSFELDRFSQEELKSSVECVRENLENLGYKIYDGRRDESYGLGCSETIADSLMKSHRLVIFLSLDFIKDDWSMLALQTGFDEMINSRSKLIFVLLPGIKEYLRQHANADASCFLIQRAIKLNYAILWSKTNFKKKHFSILLEDAMPKVTSRPQKCNSTLATSDVSYKASANANIEHCCKIDSGVLTVA